MLYISIIHSVILHLMFMYGYIMFFAFNVILQTFFLQWEEYNLWLAGEIARRVSKVTNVGVEEGRRRTGLWCYQIVGITSIISI